VGFQHRADRFQRRRIPDGFDRGVHVSGLRCRQRRKGGL
jgi:hypothetical protein